MESRDDLRKIFQTSIKINGAILVTLIIYAVIVEIIKSQYTPFRGFVDSIDMTLLRYVFYGLALFQIIIIKFIRGILLPKEASEDLKSIFIKLNKTSIITATLCEVPTIFGLALFLLGGYSRDFYLLLILSFFLSFLYFPRYRNWEEWIKANAKI